MVPFISGQVVRSIATDLLTGSVIGIIFVLLVSDLVHYIGELVECPLSRIPTAALTLALLCRGAQYTAEGGGGQEAYALPQSKGKGLFPRHGPHR